MKPNQWARANAISDALIRAFNESLVAMHAAGDVDPLQLLHGYLLAGVALQRTMPPITQPATFRALLAVIDVCLDDLQRDDEAMTGLYLAARATCHAFGVPWTDPRTGRTYPPPPEAAPAVVTPR